MQPPRSREMQTSGQIGIPELGQNGGHHHHQLQQIQNGGAGMQSHFDHAAAGGGHDDFFDQMLSTLPSAWADLGNPKSPWGDLTGSADAAAGQKLFSIGLAGKSGEEGEEGGGLQYAPYDESTLLASRLRQHQISGGGGGGGGGSQGGKGMIQLNPHHAAQQQMLLQGGVDSGLVPLPLSLGSGGSCDEGDGLYNGFGASMQQHFHHAQIPGGGGVAPAGGAAAVQGGGGGGAAAPPRQRVRARRGQATDPHSIAERLRRERIAERMRALQELVPNANKTDKASMLDEIIEYVKFLQLQVKVLSMSRLGGAAAVAPLVADISSEGGRPAAAAGGDNLAVAEHQVAKLMEEDMGSAMQYLQGKGLCLMPISLASAISSATCRPRVGGLLAMQGNGDAPSSPSMSVLTVQSAMANGGGGDAGGNSNKDAASVSKP